MCLHGFVKMQALLPADANCTCSLEVHEAVVGYIVGYIYFQEYLAVD